MADPGTVGPRVLFAKGGHVIIMAALVVMVCLATLGRCEKTEVPSSPGSSFDFNDVDTDGSGCVEGPEELQNFRLQVGRILGVALHLGNIERALRAGRITHSADVNGDGRICQCDLLSILLTETTRPGVHRHAFRVYEDGSFFDDVDSNHDGVLDDVREKGTLTQKLAQCVTADQAKSLVDSMARLADDDGKVTRDEYLMFLQSSTHQKELPPPSSLPLPQPASPPQAMPQRQLQPQQPPSLPQLQSLSQNNSPSVNRNVQISPQKPLPSSVQGQGTDSPDRPKSRPQKQPMPPFFHPALAKPAPQPSQPVHNPPAQSLGHSRHFQPMNAAALPPKAQNPAGRSADPAAQGVMNRRGQSPRAVSPRERQSMVQSSAFIGSLLQQEPGVRFQQGLSPGRLENVHAVLQNDGLQSDLIKPVLTVPGYQVQPQGGGQPDAQTGQSQLPPEAHSSQSKSQQSQPEVKSGQSDSQQGQAKATAGQTEAQSDQSEKQPNPETEPQPKSSKISKEMKNVSDQPKEDHPQIQPPQPDRPQPSLHSLDIPRPQQADASLETQLQQKRRN